MSLRYPRYTVGLLFRHHPIEPTRVLLIRKIRPAWQSGLLNGVGGRIEEGESPVECMCREFREETGCVTGPGGWRQFCVLEGTPVDRHVDPSWAVHLFTRHDGDTFAPRTMEAEQVAWYPIQALHRGANRTVPNLRWLVPMALDLGRPRAVVEDPS